MSRHWKSLSLGKGFIALRFDSFSWICCHDYVTIRRVIHGNSLGSCAIRRFKQPWKYRIHVRHVLGLQWTSLDPITRIYESLGFIVIFRYLIWYMKVYENLSIYQSMIFRYLHAFACFKSCRAVQKMNSDPPGQKCFLGLKKSTWSWSLPIPI